MKVEHYVFVFAILVIVAVVKFQGKVTNLQVMDNKSVEYNRNIDAACDDAMNDMIEVVDDYDYTVNLDSCAESFFNSLYASFGVLDSQTGQEQLKWYVPILLVTEDDGFYVMYHSMPDDKSTSTMQWTAKMPYCYSGTTDSGKSYTINFTMSDNVQILYNGCLYEGDWQYLKNFYTDSADQSNLNAVYAGISYLNDATEFAEFKQSAMQYQITKKANYYVNQHNTVAKQYGLNYSFSLPVSSTDTFARTVSDVSLLAIFQGYPYGKGTDDTYSRFSVSGAKISKKTKYYLGFKDGQMWYHRYGCEWYDSTSSGYDTKQEAASMGAYPCPYCNP
jgi:hypothetical protein